ncbi:hypothetical protein GCK32_011811 [Trichostrongylus colubriformis]|uniref:Transmembrane protein n=1 Tax=Trichostrongylus colubriformis TaxID=6319 RepID=A0AAN8GAY7_TRICO
MKRPVSFLKWRRIKALAVCIIFTFSSFRHPFKRKGCVRHSNMGDSKDMFFDLPPLPGHGTTSASTDNKTAEARTIKSKDKGGKDTGKVRVESSATTTKAPPNLGTFKILIAITWLLFFACVVGIVYVLVEYKTERDALRAKNDQSSSS